jgi:16S rRNA (uracil1498-N3)-methyltransferase
MARFFTNKESIDELKNIITITGADVNHLKNVLRSRIGDDIIVCEGSGYEYKGRILEIEKSFITIDIISKDYSETEPHVEICLFQGVAKGDRMEQLIQKAVELGVSKIVPVICKRTVVKFDGSKDIDKKTQRWQRIAHEAAKQCTRAVIPTVEKPLDFKQAILNASEYDIKFIPYEEEKDFSLRSFIKDIGEPGRTAFFIGPEGGFDEDEIVFAKEKGFSTVSLGKRILRTETAGPAVIGILRYEYGD